jgi:hypothetical protein
VRKADQEAAVERRQAMTRDATSAFVAARRADAIEVLTTARRRTTRASERT